MKVTLRLLLAATFLLLNAQTWAQTLGGDSNNNVSKSTSSETSSSTSNDPEALRELLVDITHVLQDLSQISDQTGQRRVSLWAAEQRFYALSHEELQVMGQYILSMDGLRYHLDQAQQALARLQQSKRIFPQSTTQTTQAAIPGGTRVIEFPEPETTIAICANISPTEGFILLDVTFAAREILTAITWPCLETVLGENDAVTCTATNVVKAQAEIEFQIAEACLQEQRDAVLEALMETQENVADHLSDFVDASTSSRASQTSLDAVQSDINTALSDLDTLDGILVSDFLSIETDLNQAFAELNFIAADVNSLNSVLNDIQFRAQENQAQIELADESAADAQERLLEIRSDTQSIISILNTLQSNFNSISTTAETGIRTQQRAGLAAALADPSLTIVRYHLPASAGGALEESREIVAQAILAYDNVGAKTSVATNLLAQGDLAYNNQDYLNAYSLYAQAYQNLTSTAQGVLR